VPEGTIQVSEDGAIAVEGRAVGRLAFARVPTGQPLPTADSGYFRGPGQPVAAGRGTLVVAQGYLETSNVDLATETTRMLAAQRSYQANARLMQMQDDTLGLAVNDLGKA
jgi:flagellar basal-body rod protein FlgG